jgi:acetolactate synthase I/II/III large subunit
MNDRESAAPPARRNATVAQAMAAALKRHDVELVFGQSIPSQLHLAAPECGIRQIAYRTENAGAIMADAFARVSHQVAVVTAQNGPAATLLVPGLAEALTASIPLVAIVQDVARGNLDRNAFQELDHLKLFAGCAKWVRRVHTADRVDDYVDMAFAAAAGSRPGPAVLLVPYDLFGEAAGAAPARTASLGRYPLDRMVADPAMVAAAAELLERAERPLVVAGGGVHLSDAVPELVQLQQTGALPVATTTMGKGAIDESHPLSVGVIGYFMGTGGMAKFQRSLVAEADVILFVGTRTNQNGTDSWTLFPRDARYIHLDIDGQEVGRNYEALRLVGDAKLTLAALTQELQGHDLARRQAGRRALAERIADGRRRHVEEAGALLSGRGKPARPERLMAELARRLTDDTIVVADASYASIWIANYLPARKAGMRFLTPRGLAGLGWGLPMALGAKLARPDSPVLCVVGDGGFAHVWSELETARRNRLNVVVTVLNNQILGYQKHAEDVLFGAHTSAIYFEPVDHAAIARACGLNGVRVEDPAEYGPALDRALAADTATVIDVITDPAAHPPITSFEGRL